jgi:RNA polymerase sigma-70 factor (ECF subfamily)
LPHYAPATSKACSPSSIPISWFARTWPSRPARRPRSRRGSLGKRAIVYGHLARLTRPALVNGAIGVVVAPQGRLVRALRFTIANGKITEIEVIGNPARLGELDVLIVD